MITKSPPWDQQAARILAKLLVNTSITPNQVTLFTLILALIGAGLIATGENTSINWGVGLFVLARFLDHIDGELARQKGALSKFGYYLDYTTGALSYGALFLCIGIGLRHDTFGDWALALGMAGALSAILTMFINLNIDKIQDGSELKNTVGYPSFAGFELEDGIYLIAPITWAGYITPFFIAAGIGATIYLLWGFWRFRRLRRALAANEHDNKN